MTQIQQVKELAALGVDYAGFIFYEKSPRYMVGRIDPKELRNLGQVINKTGVFVNENYNVIMKTVKEYGLDAVQLHGSETPDFCTRISSSVKTIKVFRITGNEDLGALINDYPESADYFLFDTKAKEFGGTGRKFSWDILRQASLAKPYFLSGGIAPGDVASINGFINNSATPYPYALDLNSRFEIQAGLKDLPLLKSFIEDFRREAAK